jgi:hypothetical protein
MWEGQSTGADLTRANFKQIRKELIELGLITESEFDRDVDLLAQYELLFSVADHVGGQRPPPRMSLVVAPFGQALL